MINKVKEKNLGQLARFRDGLRDKPQLASLFFELTDACNMSCLHCGSKASPENRCYLDYDSIDRVLGSVARAYDPKKIMVCLTGGEPMLHPDFYKIASRVTELGFMCGITTNASLIDGEAAERIRECGICSISISLDGTEKDHDWFRNRSGAYEKTIKGIQNLVKASRGRITLQVTTVANKKTLSTLDEIYRTVTALGVDSWRVINIEPIGRALEQKELLLDSTELRYLLDYVREKRFSPDVSIHVTYGCSHYLGEEYENEVRDHYFMCGAGIIIGSVLCNGDVFPCLDIERRPELVQGNIHRDDFVEVWEKGFEFFRKDRTELCADCRECTEREFCGGDSAHTWSYSENMPLLCHKHINGEHNGI